MDIILFHALVILIGFLLTNHYSFVIMHYVLFCYFFLFVYTTPNKVINVYDQMKSRRQQILGRRMAMEMQLMLGHQSGMTVVFMFALCMAACLSLLLSLRLFCFCFSAFSVFLFLKVKLFVCVRSVYICLSVCYFRSCCCLKKKSYKYVVKK